MTRIQSSVGLITGIKIEETVNQLMAVAARPKELIAARSQALGSERLAINNLTSLMLAFKFEANRLGSPSLYQTKTVTSSKPDALAARLIDGANAPVGNYQVRSLQTASSQQLASTTLQSLDDLSTTGKLTFDFGGFVDKGISLDQLNAGQGVRRGKIRITDRAGNSAEIDLRAARTIDDVLKAINGNTSTGVTAEAAGDAIRLVDGSGGAGNLRVQEVGGGKTALDLGLAGVNVAAAQATGSDILSLHAGARLSALNDGNGVPLADGNDLSISLADEAVLNIDLGNATTLGDVLNALNAANPAKLSAAISADGNRLELTDLTSGAGVLAVTSVGSGKAAEALGLTVAADGDTLTGRRLISGLRDTLVTSLRGGAGLGTLGTVDITNRANVSSSVDLSNAETLGDILAAINGQAVGVSAAVNSARNGIVLTDTSGSLTGNLVVADGDAHASATALGIVFSGASASHNSGSLGRQQVGRATLLSSLNGGRGVDLGDLLITDSNGATGAVDLNTAGSEPKTVGDVIDRINALATVQVEARINSTGDGILLIDNANGLGTLKVKQVGSRNTAADLGLLSPVTQQEIGGVQRQVIDGTSKKTIDLAELDDAGVDIALDSLNGGAGIKLGAFRITDRNGQSATIALNASGANIKTVGDVIAAINATNIGVEARINDAKTGILLFDTSGGSGTLRVTDLAGGTAAADLRLAGNGAAGVVGSVSTQVINGAGLFAPSSAQTGLNALATRINQLAVGVTASAVFDGGGYRLLLAVDETGAGRELLVDGLAAGLEFEELSAARDAVVELGGSQAGAGLLLTSSTNTFDNVIPGVEVTIASAADETVVVSVAKSQSATVEVVQDFVDAFNSIRTNLDTATAFNPDTLTTGILFGTTAALRVESDLNRILTARYFGVGNVTSLAQIGITFDDKGKLLLNAQKLQEALDSDSAAVERFFSDKSLGFSAKLQRVVDQLAGENNSVLSSRANSLTQSIDVNSERIAFMDERLARERERLLAQFTALESTIAALQRSLTALSGLQIIPPLTSTRSR